MADTAWEMVLDRIKDLKEDLKEFRSSSEESRRELHRKIEATNLQLAGLSARVEIAEKSIVGHSEKVREFVTVQEQINGAGKLGRALWSIGKILLWVAAGAASMWAAFWTHFQWK